MTAPRVTNQTLPLKYYNKINCYNLKCINTFLENLEELGGMGEYALRSRMVLIPRPKIGSKRLFVGYRFTQPAKEEACPNDIEANSL